MVIKTDNENLVKKWGKDYLFDSDVRVFRRLAWLVANEHNLTIQYVPGSMNTGADILTRPILEDWDFGDQNIKTQVATLIADLGIWEDYND